MASSSKPAASSLSTPRRPGARRSGSTGPATSRPSAPSPPQRQRDPLPAQALQPQTARRQGKRGNQRRGGVSTPPPVEPRPEWHLLNSPRTNRPRNGKLNCDNVVGLPN